MNKPLVSVITVVYNGEKYIESAIRSVLHQTYDNIEYIIIDGGSTDNTPGIIEKYKSKIALSISEKDRGISDAFNKGISHATGEIIGILNADDWYEKDTVEKIMTQMANADVIYGDLRLWNNDKVDFILKGNHQSLDSEMRLNHPTVFVKKHCYTRFGVFNEMYKCGMDYDMMLRLKINGCQFAYIPSVLANMRWGGLSDAKWMLGCTETLSIKNKYLRNKKLLNHVYFIKHIMAIAVPKFLTHLHLGFIVKKYRLGFSRMKNPDH